MNPRTKNWLQVVVLAAPFCAAALLWNRLPERMPIHWGLTGQPDRYAGKLTASLLLPCINLAFTALFLLLPRIDPRFVRYDEETKASLRNTFRSMCLAFTSFMSAVGLAVVATPVYPSVHAVTIATVGVGALLFVFGNLMTKLRPNWFVGFRTPWTLRSREVWTKTHRLAGRLMMAGGMCIFVAALLLPTIFLFLCVLLPVALLTSLIPMVYSYKLHARLPPTAEPKENL